MPATGAIEEKSIAIGAIGSVTVNFFPLVAPTAISFSSTRSSCGHMASVCKLCIYQTLVAVV